MKRKRVGWIFIVATSVSLALLLQFAPPTAYSAGPKFVSKLGVFDGDNKFVGVGDVLNAQPDSTRVLVALKLAGQTVGLIMDRDGFVPQALLLFEAPDTTCSGTPLLYHPSTSPMLPLGAIGPPGNTVYIPDPSAVPQTRSLGSFISNVGVCTSASFIIETVSTQALGNLGTFTPPFSVRAE